VVVCLSNQTHEICQTFGSVGCVSFAVMQIVTVKTTVLNTHALLGRTITGILVWQIINGNFSRWRLGTSAMRWWHRPLAKCHKYLGFFLVTIGPYQVYLGIDQLWPGVQLAKALYFAAIGMLISVFVTAESYRRINAVLHAKRTHEYFSSTDAPQDDGLLSLHGPSASHPARKMLLPQHFDSLPSLTWADVSTRVKTGSKLLVISGVVLDVRPFVGAHPGGRTILEDAIGTDATPAFFGIDPEAPFTHTHSSFAWKKLQAMAVGTLKPEADIEGAHRASVDLGTAPGAATRARRLNQLLHDRRVQSKPLAGESAHYRRYRIVSKTWLTKTVVKLSFEQVVGVHPRPFAWKEYFAHSKDDIRLRMEASGGGDLINSGPTFVSRALVGITNLVVGNQRARVDRRGSLIAPTAMQAALETAKKTKWGIVKKESMSPRGLHRDEDADGAAGEKPVAIEMSEPAVPHRSEAAVHPDPDSPPPQMRQRTVAGRPGAAARVSSLADIAAQQMMKASRPYFLSPGEHIELQVLVDSEAIERPYTPVPVAPGMGGVSDTLELVIKIYPKGQMTQFLGKRDVGDYVKMRGPLGRDLRNPLDPGGLWPRILMISGGAGLTPMLGLIHHHLASNQRLQVKEQRTRIVMMQFDRSASDIILQDDLAQLVAASDGCFIVHHILTEAENSGIASTRAALSRFRGRISAGMVAEVLQEMGASEVTPISGSDSSLPRPPSRDALHPPNGTSYRPSISTEQQQNDPGLTLVTPLVSPLNFASDACVSVDNSPRFDEDDKKSTLEAPTRPSLVQPEVGMSPHDSRISPHVFVCGPLDFNRAALGALDDNKFDMTNVDVL
jgi:ferredoxin-NADP reductase